MVLVSLNRLDRVVLSRVPSFLAISVENLRRGVQGSSAVTLDLIEEGHWEMGA